MGEEPLHQNLRHHVGRQAVVHQKPRDGMGWFEIVPQQYHPETDDAVDQEELYQLVKGI